MARTRRTYEAPEVGAAAGRMLRGLVRRAADGDTEALEQLLSLEAQLTQNVAEAGAGLRRFGYSLSELARVTGTTRQACSKRFALAERVQ